MVNCRFPDPIKPSQLVFDTPELTEKIFSHMSEKDLLVSAQRVSHAWRNCIVQSPKLQRKLFFTEGILTDYDYNQAQSRAENPLLKGRFWVDLKYWLRRGFRIPPLEEDPEKKAQGYNKLARDLPLYPLLHPLASWHRMLTHVPPFRGVGFMTELLSEPNFSRCGITGVDSNSDQQLELPWARAEDIVRVYEDQCGMKLVGRAWAGQSQPSSVSLSLQDIEILYAPFPDTMQKMRLTDAPAHTLAECEVVVKAVLYVAD
ncbi:hypothetical protein F5Y16DRAFT_425122 [Xylariaceae sp. FL0255]|nr:hypothetical protein F5Y16DRAFT_425122 [Xylariaceae sp. FL0255]